MYYVYFVNSLCNKKYLVKRNYYCGKTYYACTNTWPKAQNNWSRSRWAGLAFSGPKESYSIRLPDPADTRRRVCIQNTSSKKVYALSRSRLTGDSGKPSTSVFYCKFFWYLMTQTFVFSKLFCTITVKEGFVCFSDLEIYFYSIIGCYLSC